MLVFTNRVVDASATDESAFSARFAPKQDVLGIAQVPRRPRARKGARWSLTVYGRCCDAALQVCEVSQPP